MKDSNNSATIEAEALADLKLKLDGMLSRAVAYGYVLDDAMEQAAPTGERLDH